MKLGLYADPHFSQSSSIIVGRKGEFTGRLDNLIKSFTWMNQFFKYQGVDEVVCLGDLTDKPVLTAEEITAMSKCGINEHYLLVGNHCRSDKDGKINSLSIYKHVVSDPGFVFDGVYFLPYNHDLIDLSGITPRPRVILSHNDLRGYDLGGHILKDGYEIENIVNNCDLFINGHLHNGGWVVKDRIVNLGNLSGVNFSSCGGQWEPSVAILDTETLEFTLYENPEAYRFKKVECKTLPKLKSYLDSLKNDYNGYYVLQVKVPDTISEKARKLVSQCDRVEASRIITYSTVSPKERSSEIKIVSETKTIYNKLKLFVEEQKPKYDIDTINKIIDKISTEEDGAV